MIRMASGMGRIRPFERNHRGWSNRVRRKRNAEGIYPFIVAGMAVLAGYAVVNSVLPENTGLPKNNPDAYYPNCDAARAAGVAPIYAGKPGYREELDGDGDGVACEPYRAQ